MESSTYATPLRLPRPAQTMKAAAFGAVLLLAGASLALAAYRFPPPSMQVTVAAGIAPLLILALALARYHAAVALGFALIGVQAVEPAPADAIFAIVIAVAALTGRFDPSRAPLLILGSLGVLLVVNVASAMEAVSAPRAGFFFAITLYLAVFAVWLADYVKSEWRAGLVVKGYLVAAATSAVLGVVPLLVPVPAADLFLYSETRAQALFKDPNVLGPFLVPIILILLEEILSPRLLRLRRPFKIVLLLLLTSALLLALSRAAWLNMAVGVVVLLGVMSVRQGGLRRIRFVIPILAITAVAGSIMVSASGTEALFEQRSSGLQQYDTQRFGAQEAGLELAETHPLGIGPGQFDPVVKYAAHSTFVRVFAEQGFLGIAAFLVLLLATLVFALRNVGLGRSTFGIGSAALLGAWCGLIANSFFVDTLHWRHLWLVAALIWAGTMRGAIAAPEPGPAGGADPRRSDAPPAGPRPGPPALRTGRAYR